MRNESVTGHIRRRDRRRKHRSDVHKERKVTIRTEARAREKKARPLLPARVLMNLFVGTFRSHPLLVRASPMDCQAPRQKLRRNTPTHPPSLPASTPAVRPRFAAPTPTHTDEFSTRSPRARARAFHDSVKHGHRRRPARTRFSRSFHALVPRARH